MDLKIILLGIFLVILLAVEDTSGKTNWADYYAKRFKLSTNSLQRSLTQSRRASRIGQTFKRDMGGSRVARRIQPRGPPGPVLEVAGHELPNLKEHIKKPWTSTSGERKIWPKHIKLELARRPWLMKRYQSPQSMKYKPWSNVHDNTWHQTQIKRSQEQKTNKPLFEAQPAYRFQPRTIKVPQILPKPVELKLPLTQSEISYQVRPATEFIFKPLSQLQDEPIEVNSSEETGVLTLIEKSIENKDTGTNETKYFEYRHESMGEKTIISSASAERKHTDQGLLASILVEKPSSINNSIITAEASELRIPPSQDYSSQVQAVFRPEPVVSNINPRRPIILSPPQEMSVNSRPQSEIQYLERQPEEFQENPIKVQSHSTLPPDSLELITEFEEHVGDEMVKTKHFEYTNGDMKETKIISSVSATNTHVDQGLVAKVIVENPPLPLVQNSSDNQAAFRPDNLILRIPQVLPQPKEISLTGSTSGPQFLEGSNTDFVAAPDTLQLIETIEEGNNKTQLYEYNNKSPSNEHIIISSVSIQKPNNDQGILSKIIIDKPAIPLSIRNTSDNLEASHLRLPENNGFENSQPGYRPGIISYESRNYEVQSLPILGSSPKPRFEYAERRPEEIIINPNVVTGDNDDNGLKLIETFDEDNGYDMNTTNLFEYNKESGVERMIISSVSVKQPNINQGMQASVIIDNSTSDDDFSNGVQSLPQPELRSIPNTRPSLPIGYLLHRPTEYVSLATIQSENNQDIIRTAESRLLESRTNSKPVYLLGTPTMYQPLVGDKVDNSVTERSTKPFSYVGHRYEGDIISKNTGEEPYISSGFIDIHNDPLPLVETNPLLGNIAAAYSNPGQAFAESYHVQVHDVDDLP